MAESTHAVLLEPEHKTRGKLSNSRYSRILTIQRPKSILDGTVDHSRMAMTICSFEYWFYTIDSLMLTQYYNLCCLPLKIVGSAEESSDLGVRQPGHKSLLITLLTVTLGESQFF